MIIVVRLKSGHVSLSQTLMDLRFCFRLNVIKIEEKDRLLLVKY